MTIRPVRRVDAAAALPMKTGAIMWTVAAALLPVAGVVAYERGGGALWQIIAAAGGCVFFEAACLRVRRLPILQTLGDGSAVVAGIIIGLSLPPYAPYYVAIAAAAFAMILAKHCYGGLGNNPFNPAMAGYALAFISFPGDFGGWNAAADAVSMPTPLSAARLGVESPPLSYWFSFACIGGGAALLLLRIADWRLPAAFILGALLFAGGEWRTLFAGGFMLAAFFVITDPATAAATARGRWLYGFAAGALTALLRERGLHTDGIAFAILFCNMLAPLADMRRR